ncbi:MAG: HEAT repeat domain-containing protein [Methylococcales bacterium]
MLTSFARSLICFVGVALVPSSLLAGVLPRTVPFLVEALKYEPYWVRVEIVDALSEGAKVGDPTAVPALIEVLNDDSEKVRRKAVDAFVQIGNAAVPALVEALKNDSYTVRDALAGIGKPAVRALIEALKDDSENVRAGAADVLGKIGDPATVSALVEVA